MAGKTPPKTPIGTEAARTRAPNRRVLHLAFTPAWSEIRVLDSDYPDLRRFNAIETADGQLEATNAWSSRTRHCPHSLELSGEWLSDLQYLRTPGEEIYLRALQDLPSEPFGEITFDTRYVCTPKPWLRVWWTSGRWPREIRDEHRMRNTRGVFLGYHNVEYHQMRPADRSRLYVPVPRWWSKYEVDRSLPVPLPAVVAYRGFDMATGGP